MFENQVNKLSAYLVKAVILKPFSKLCFVVYIGKQLAIKIFPRQ
jgi:hypothetical protein